MDWLIDFREALIKHLEKRGGDIIYLNDNCQKRVLLLLVFKLIIK
jgi:hypothetical protein